MDNDLDFVSYLYLSKDKFSICILKIPNLDIIYEKEILINNLYNELDFEQIKYFLDENIIKSEQISAISAPIMIKYLLNYVRKRIRLSSSGMPYDEIDKIIEDDIRAHQDKIQKLMKRATFKDLKYFLEENFREKIAEATLAALECAGPSGTITFEHSNVSNIIVEAKKFYEFDIIPDENILIQNLDLEINKGEFIGIFGDSGSGKSTLADIMLGFFEPNNGDIIIDGIKKKITTDFWKTKIGYVPQEVNLLDDTILKNITYQLEDKNIDQEALKKAINQSQLQNFIKESTSGINTIIGEKGFKISGGQRQRIGIARAIYNNPEIIIFDESTSSLDKEAESNLLNSIYSLKNKVTVIFISHDLNLLSRCDSVYKLQDKKLIKS